MSPEPAPPFDPNLGTDPESACPYVGLRAYTADDSAFFHGRASEIERISANVRAWRLTILYGQSGVGKSSILQAGIIPDLRRHPRNIVVYFKDWQQRDPTRLLRKECLKRMEAAPLPSPRLPRQDDGTPGSEFYTEPEPRTPTEDSPLTEFGQTGRGTLFLLLDQFEDYLLLDDYDWRHGNSFDIQLARAVTRDDVDIHVLIGIREEDVSKLDRLRSRIPSLLSNTVRLSSLTDDGAAEAIRGPVATYNKPLPYALKIAIGDDGTPASAERLISSVVAGAKEGTSGVDASVLQLVMERLWKEECRAWRSAGQPQPRRLRLATIERLRGVNGIVEGYVEGAMKSLGRRQRKTAAPPPTLHPDGTLFSRAPKALATFRNSLGWRQRDTAALMFRELVSSKGDRVSRFVKELASVVRKQETEVSDLLDTLEDDRILRRIAPNSCEIRPALSRAVLQWRTRYFKKRAALRTALKASVVLVICSALFSWYSEQHRTDLDTARRLALLADRQLEKDPALSLTLSRYAILRLSHQEGHTSKGGGLRTFFGDLLYRTLKLSTGNTSEDASVLFAAKDVLYKGVEVGRLLENSRDLNNCNDKTNVNLEKNSANGVSYWPDIYSPDEYSKKPSVLAASCENFVKVWSPNRAPVVLKYPPDKPSGVSQAIISPTGRFIATADDDHSARIWEWSTGALYKSLGDAKDPEGHKDEVWGVAFSPDEKYLATASKDKFARIWSIETGRCLYKLRHDDTVVSAAFSPNGCRLATASLDHTAAIWEPKSGCWEPHSDYRKLSLEEHTSGVYSVAFSPDGKWLATTSADGTARIWDSQNGKTTRFFLTGSRLLWGVAFSRDNKWLAAAGRDGIAKIWEWQSGREIFNLVAGVSEFSGIAFNRDGTLLAAGTTDGFVQRWDVSFPRITQPDLTDITKVVFNSEGTRLAAGSTNNVAGIWDVSNGKVVWKTSDAPSDPKRQRLDVSAIALCSARNQIVTGSSMGKVDLWNTQTNGSLVKTIIEENASGITALACESTGRYVAFGDWSGRVSVWDRDSARISSRKLTGFQRIRYLAFSGQGRRLAVAAEKDPAAIYFGKSSVSILELPERGFAQIELSKFRVEKQPEVDADLSGDSSALAFSSDGNRLAVGFVSGDVLILNLLSHKAVPLSAPLYKHTAQINAIAFDSDTDGKGPPTDDRIATASDDGRAKVWDSHNGNLILTTYGHAGGVLGAYFANHDTLTTAGSDKTIRSHELRFDEQFKKAESLGRLLKAPECAVYFPNQSCPAEK